MQKTIVCFVVISLVASVILAQNSKGYVNPSILQDSRNLPQTDGTFGFLYRTEDGIAHAAVGDPNGRIHGRFTYTDPTGLKVNYNYNTGSRTAPGQRYEQNKPSAAKSQPQPQPEQETYADYEEYPAPQQPSYTRSRPRQQSSYDA